MIANPLNSMITNYFNEEEKNRNKWLPSPAFKAFSGMFDGVDTPDTFLGDTPAGRKGKGRTKNAGAAKPSDPYSKEIIGGIMTGLPGMLRYMEKSNIPRMTMTARPEEETYY